MRDSVRLALRLMLFALVAGLLLAGANEITKGPIAERRDATVLASRQEVLPDANRFEEVTTLATADYPDVSAVFRGFEGDTPIGYAIVLRPMGYKAEIAMTLGINSAGALTRLVVNNHSETLGLGSRIAEYPYLSQFTGLAADPAAIHRQVDGITGATISHRAVEGAVEQAARFATSELGIVGQADRTLAEAIAPTPEEVKRMALLEGTSTRALPLYNALGFDAIYGVDEIKTPGGTGYVFTLMLDGESWEVMLAIDAQGAIYLMLPDRIHVRDDFMSQIDAAWVHNILDKLTPDGAAEEKLAKAVRQAVEFYQTYLHVGEE